MKSQQKTIKNNQTLVQYYSEALAIKPTNSCDKKSKYWSEFLLLRQKKVNRFSPIIYSCCKYCNIKAVGMSYVILLAFFRWTKELNDYFNRLFPGATGTTMAVSTIWATTPTFGVLQRTMLQTLGTAT